MYTKHGKNRFLYIFAAFLIAALLVCAAGAEEIAVEDVPVIGTAVSEPQKAELIGTVLQETSVEPVEFKTARARAEGVLQEGEFPRAEDDGVRAELQAVEENYLGAIEKLAAGMRAREELIEIEEYGIPLENGKRLMANVFNENPDLFYVDASYSYQYDEDTRLIIAIAPIYKTEYTEADSVRYQEICDEIISRVDPNWSDIQKMLFLHDYIITHCEYDRSYTNYNAYNALVEGSAVCQGYSQAFSYLARRLGLTAEFVSSDEMNHAWNAVMLDGEMFYIDCTHDDPTSQGGGLYEAYCLHENFLRSREGMEETGHTGTDWVCGTQNCYNDETSSRYDEAWWIKLRTAVAQLGSVCAYADPRAEDFVYLRDMESGKVDKISLPGKVWWPYWPQPEYSYDDLYYSFAVKNGLFFFTTPEDVWTLAPDGELWLRYTITEEEKAAGRLYGIVEEDGELYYSIGEAPADVPFSRKKLPAQVGDVNDDDRHNAKDVTLLRRELAGGYVMSLAEEALDVNRDGAVNAKDITILRRFLADDYDVGLG